MSGIIISDFNDLNEATGSAWINTPKGLIMEGVKQEYLSSRLFDGSIAGKKMIQAGVNIRHAITFRDNGTFNNYLPGEYRTWRNPQRLDHSQAPWRFSEAHKSWTDPEILLNPRVAFSEGDARTQAYVDIMYEKDALLMGTLWNGLEDNLGAVPNYDSMENADSTDPKPYSFFAMLNEDTRGLWGKDWAGGAPTGSWNAADSTIFQIDPTDTEVNGRWQPKQRTYSAIAQSATVGNGIFGAFELMDLDVKFLKPKTLNQYWEDERMRMQMIICSTVGHATVSYLCHNGNDQFRAGPQDGSAGSPLWHGVPFLRWDTLDTAAVFEPAAGTTPTIEGGNLYGLTAAGAAGAAGAYEGPRFYWVNANYMCVVVHGDRFFFVDKVARHPNVPDTWVQPTTIWYNYKQISRQRHGVVSPANNTMTGFPGS